MNTKFSESKLAIKDLDYVEEVFKDISSVSGGLHQFQFQQGLPTCPPGFVRSLVTLSSESEDPFGVTLGLRCIPRIPIL